MSDYSGDVVGANIGVHGDVSPIDTGTGDPIGHLTEDVETLGLSLYGHRLVLNGEDGIKCEECEMEEQIPDVFEMSSGFREVVYKMYILGKFKHAECDTSLSAEDLITDDDVDNFTGYDPSKVQWVSGDTYTTNGSDVQLQIPSGQEMRIDGTNYIYRGSGTFMNAETAETLSVDELQQRHGVQADAGIAGASHPSDQGLHTQAQQPSVTIQGDDLTQEEKKTLKEKAAKSLKDNLNYLTR